MFHMNEMEALFNIKKVGKSGVKFDERKLEDLDFGKIGIGTTSMGGGDGAATTTKLLVANGNAGFGNTEVMTVTGPIHPIHVSDASNASILIDSYSDTVGTSAKLYLL